MFGRTLVTSALVLHTFFAHSFGRHDRRSNNGFGVSPDIFAVVLDHFEKTALRASPRTPLMKNTARVVFSCENKIMTLVSPVGFIAKEGEGEDLSSFFSHSHRCFACRAWRRCGGMLHAACVSSWSSCCTRCLKRLENFPLNF